MALAVETEPPGHRSTIKMMMDIIEPYLRKE
jgi:hypothetical protein